MSQLDLFKPTDRGKSLLDEYPELRDIPEFSDLSSDEILFAYYMGCPTSRYVLHEDSRGGERNKIQHCIKASFGDSLSDVNKTKYLNGNIPEPIRMAIERFKQFNPSARMRAKIMIDKVFDTYESILNPDEDMQSVLKTDLETQVKFISASQKIAAALPDLIKLKESGFGVSVSGSDTVFKGTEDGDPTLLDLALQTK